MNFVWTRLVLLALLALLAGCGSDESDTPAQGTPTAPATPTSSTVTEPAAPMDVRVYLLRDGRIAAVERSVTQTKAVARAALEALLEGPTELERELGLTSELPADLAIDSLTIADGIARVDLSGGACPPLAQIVYTLTQFPTVERVAGNCVPAKPLDRAEFEDVTPAVLVESPTPGESVRSPLRLRGTANTFEATFMINVVDWDGRIVAETFATATSGSGQRGTFDVTVPFEVGRPGGALIVFEASAEDGRPIHVVEIPLQLQP